MKSTLRRVLFAILSVLIFTSFTACNKAEQKPTQEPDTAEITATATTETTEKPAVDTFDVEKHEAAIEAAEILEHLTLRETMSAKGTLTRADSFKTVNVTTEADLEPYRNAFGDLIDDEIKSKVGAEGTKTVLIEIMGRQINCSYVITSVYKTENVIEVAIDETEEDVDQVEYTFLLLHIPAEHYASEELVITFTD